jgi:hypothetical protein
MAEITLLRDDLTGDTEDVETREFSLDGTDYEIDLSGSNYDDLRNALAPFIEKARRGGRSGYQPRRRASSTIDRRHGSTTGHMDTEQKRALRRWAQQHFSVGDRGRIPQEIVDAYNAGDPNHGPAARWRRDAAVPTEASFARVG